MGGTLKVRAIVRGRHMGSTLKIVTAIAIISLLSFVLVACASTPLTLTITAPTDGATLTSSALTVTGTVSDTNAEVRVNNIFASAKSGRFSQNIQLTQGKNVITIVATVGKTTVTKQVTVTYAPPAK